MTVQLCLWMFAGEPEKSSFSSFSSSANPLFESLTSMKSTKSCSLPYACIGIFSLTPQLNELVFINPCQALNLAKIIIMVLAANYLNWQGKLKAWRETNFFAPTRLYQLNTWRSWHLKFSPLINTAVTVSALHLTVDLCNLTEMFLMLHPCCVWLFPAMGNVLWNVTSVLWAVPFSYMAFLVIWLPCAS